MVALFNSNQEIASSLSSDNVEYSAEYISINQGYIFVKANIDFSVYNPILQSENESDILEYLQLPQ